MSRRPKADAAREIRALRELAERYLLVARATHDVIWDWNLVTGEAVWHEALRTVFGYAPAEAGSTTEEAFAWWIDHVHPEDRERVATSHQAVLAAGGDVSTGEYRFRRRDGSYATILDRGYVQRGPDGTPLRILGSMLDITERKQAEEERERRRREAEVMAELVRKINASLDLDVVLQRVTDSARELCASDLAEIGLWDVHAGAVVLRYWAGVCSPGYKAGRVEGGKGAGGRVITTRRPFRTDDYARDDQITKDYLASSAAEGVVAQLVVPILMEDRLEGLLYVSNRSRNPFTLDDEAILMRLADHAAIAIQNTRLFAEAERQRREAEALAEVGQLISQSLDLEEVARRIADSVRRLLRALASTLYRLEPVSGDLVAVALSDAEELQSPAGRSLCLPRGTGLSGLALQEGRAVTTPNILADPRIGLPPEVRAGFEENPLPAGLSVPLLVKGRAIGTLAVADRAGRVFGEDDIRLAQAFADQAAVALENARLFEAQSRLLGETRRQHEEALALELVARHITSSLERDEVLQRIVDRARALCGCDFTFLAPYDPDTDSAAVVTASGARSRALFSLTISRGRGMGGIVLETGEPFVSDDYLRDTRVSQDYAEVAAAEGTVSAAVVPLMLRGAITGLLCAVNRTPRPFTPRDLGILSKLADQAAIALENSRLYAERTRAEVELRVRAQQQAAIAEFGRRALESTDLDALLNEALALAARTLDVEYGHVLELQPGDDVLLLRAGLGWKPGAVGHATVATGTDSQAGYTLLRDEPVIADDLGTETRFTTPPLLRDHGIPSGLTVVIRGRPPFGVFGAFASRPRRFGEDEASFLRSVANVLAAAIERHRGERAVRESEARFRAAFEQSRLGRALQALDGRYLRVNRALCDMLGYSEEELLATHWQALTPPEDVEQELALDARMLGGEADSYQLEKRYVSRSGVIVWAALSVTLLRDAAGQPLHFLAEIQDVTPRKRAEEALRDYAERLEILHEADQAILLARSPAEIAAASLRHIRRRLTCQRAGVALFEPDEDAATIAFIETDVATRVGPGTRVPLEVFGVEELRRGTVHVVEDILSLPRLLPIHDDLLAEGVRSYVNIPLIAQGELIGSLNLSASLPGAFQAHDVEIAREVADSLAVALHGARMFDEVRAGRERLQALSRRLVEVQEAERRHLARELHDEIGQVLTALKLSLEISARTPGAGSGSLDEAHKLVDDLISRVRELSLELRPAMLDDLGLLPALVWHFERYTEKTGIRVVFEHAGLEARFPPEVGTAAYRIVQEALTNVARHAGVDQATVWVWTDGGGLQVHVEDLGRGFDPAAVAAPEAVGLTGMRERAALLGGHVTIESAPGAGTRVTAGLPLASRLERRRRR
ncbi:MAG TPA: GAF domain-containing protein [Methylomirabilota bacterium]|nr:GAF domain-containing protein [Methylomirabilota bacterium]